MLVAPVFSSRTVPKMVKAGLVVVLTATLFPVAAGTAVENVALTPLTAVTETLIGFTVGFAVAILIGATEAMGDLLAVQIGISGAAALDPLTSQSVPILGTFASLFATTLLLAMNGHILMIEAVAQSLNLMPVGMPVNLHAGLSTVIGWGSELFILATRFAAPVIATVLLANVAMAVLGRAAPQLNILAVAFPIQIGVGLVVFSATIPLIATWFAGFMGTYNDMLGEALNALRSGGGL